MLILVLMFLQTQYWHGEAGVVMSKNAKIQGGVEIDITEAPYQVALFRKGHITCGGALIAKDIVLTAASCVDKRDNASFYKVRAGSSFFFEGGEYHLVSKFIRHPHTHTVKLINDVALMWLSKPVIFSDKVAVVPMKEEGEEIDDGEVTQLTGWGFAIGKDDVIPFTKLQKVMVPTVNSSLCAKQVKHQIAPQMMCAGTPKGDKGFCYQDWGAPLVHNGKLAGVASWFTAETCTSVKTPSQIYTKVSAMRSWIDETIQNNASNN